MTPAGAIILLRQCDGKTPWHIARPGSDRGICGVKPSSFEIVHGVDQRVVAHAGRPVCVNCLDRLTAGGGSGIVTFPTRKEHDMTTRKKAASTPLLDPETYADQPLERLQAERLTINNRLSGVGTQIKRFTAAGDSAKLAAAEGKRDELAVRRRQIAEAIAAKKASTPGAGIAAAVAEHGDLAGKTTGTAKTRTTRKAATSKASPKRKTAAKRKTTTKAKTVTKRKTSTRRAT